MTRSRVLIAATFVVIALMALSGVQPYDRTTWALEVFPVVIALPVLWLTYRSFPLTSVLYVSIFIHALVLIIGGTYTYARVPLGFYVADLFDWNRNPYDKVGHFLQGFVPALVAREIFIRCQAVRGRSMIAFLSVCTALAVSAVYEILEWTAAIIMGQRADDFLGTQGDVWDTQSDMFMALVGAGAALTFLARLQDRQLTRAPKCRRDGA